MKTGVLAIAVACFLMACASTDATVGQRNPLPIATPPTISTVPEPSPDVHSHCGEFAPPRPVTDPYDASKLPVLSKVLFYARENYVDPKRFGWNRALLGALTALPHVAPEISVDASGEALPVAVTVAIGGRECRVPIIAIREPWEMRSNIQDVMKLVQGSLPPLPAAPAGRRLLDLEIAAANGMLSTFDSHSILLDRQSFPVTNAASKSFGAPGRVLAGPRKVGYLRLARLTADATTGVSEALAHFAQAGVVGIILDLRGDPGGLFEQAGTIVDAFAKHGLIVSFVAKSGRTVTEAHDDGAEPTVPVVVLTDHVTAAGAAIIAAGLHDLAGAVLFGAATDVNTSVQGLYDISSPLDVLQRGLALALKLTIGQWHLGEGRSLDGTGVVPDVAMDPKVLALDGPDASPEVGPAVAAARDALTTVPTPDRAAVIAAARAAVRSAEMKALPSSRI